MFAEILQKGLYATKIAPGTDSIPVLGLVILVIGSYLLGSLNSAVIVSRLLYREDVRTKGSGNAGLTNMYRNYGKIGALFTLLGDLLKTVLAVGLTGLFFGFYYRTALSFSPACYIAAFYGFRGGKGMLCASVAILMLAPPVFGFLFVAFVVIVAMTKYISLGSILTAGFLPLALQGYMQAFLYSGEEEGFFEGGIVLFGFVFAVIIILCHRANIGRLWRHEENRFSFHRGEKMEKKNDKQ